MKTYFVDGEKGKNKWSGKSWKKPFKTLARALKQSDKDTAMIRIQAEYKLNGKNQIGKMFKKLYYRLFPKKRIEAEKIYNDTVATTVFVMPQNVSQSYSGKGKAGGKQDV